MVSLAMILHDHGSLGKILARSCQDLGKHTHASWQACQDSCHWEGFGSNEVEKKIVGNYEMLAEEMRRIILIWRI